MTSNRGRKCPKGQMVPFSHGHVYGGNTGLLGVRLRGEDFWGPETSPSCISRPAYVIPTGSPSENPIALRNPVPLQGAFGERYVEAFKEPTKDSSRGGDSLSGKEGEEAAPA